MIEVLRALCEELSRSAVSAREVANSLGTIAEDRGEVSPLVVAPRSPEVAGATVVRQAGTDEPAYVELTPSDPNALSIQALVSAFGEYTRLPRPRPGAPARVAFYPGISGPTHTCAIIAEVVPGRRGLDDATVSAVLVRRDVKLD